jgi:phage-related protein
MALPYFIWGTTDSRTMGIIVNDYPPRKTPKARVSEIVVPGRSGTLTVLEGTDVFENLVLPFQCAALPTTDIEAVSAWLTGSGDLVIGDNPTRSIKARIDAEVVFEKLVRGQQYRGFTIPFVCQPGRYVYPEPADITLSTNPQTLVSTATLDSMPLITLTGTGTCTLTVGAYTLSQASCAGATPLLIDCEAMTVTNVAKSVSYIGNMTGAFPRLITGNNVVSHTGTVAGVVIKPRYRWL